LRRATFSVYRGVRGVQNKSTLTLFRRASENGYGAVFPVALNDTLAESYQAWFPKLRLLRTETTHGETGVCSIHKPTGYIRYRHGAATGGNRDLTLDDLVGYSNETYRQVIALTELFFKAWFEALLPFEGRHVCGIFKGRAYERMVAPTPTLSFNDGRCWSRVWFETETEFLCPMRLRCGAFARPVSKAERDHYFNRGTPA